MLVVLLFAGEDRYYFGADWVSIHGLFTALKAEMPLVSYGESVCVLVAIHGRVPCSDRRCVVPLRIRPHFTDFMVLKQLFERGDFSFLHRYNFTTVLDAGMSRALRHATVTVVYPLSV